MAKLTVIVNTCDLCGVSDRTDGITVSAHEIRVDKAGANIDACDSCWAPFKSKAEVVLAAGRGMRGVRKTLDQAS